MRTFQGNDLLPGIDKEILIAKSDTIWQNSQSLNLAQPYIFITSFCEHKKHKTSLRANKFSSPNASPSKSPIKSIRGRRNIHSAASSPNLSLKTLGDISQNPARVINLEENIDLDLNANLYKDGTPRSKSEANLIENRSVLDNTEECEKDPLLSIQPIEMYDEKTSEKWFLKCVCGVKTGEGNLICCDQCGFWQHCICFNYNAHTSPEKYVCVFCSQKRIRCKCGNNLDYNFSIIQCSNCHYYVHRRCEGLNYGPIPTETDFLCHFCGKSKHKYRNATLPTKNLSTNSLSIADSMYYFDQSRLNQINTSIINLNSSPFKKLIYNKFLGKEINAKTFFEVVYNKYRTLFYICHPLFTSTTSKKKRNRLLTSFLSAFEYLVFIFYGIMHEKFVELIDNLIFDDLYMKHDFTSKSDETGQSEETLELSENARLEVPNLLNNTSLIVILSSIPKSPPLRQTKASGLMTMCDLHPDQFVLLVDGFIGDIEEFPYDPKVDSAYYQISGTRFVLDTTRVLNSPLHLMKRSIYGNCVLKLISFDGAIKCGLFISKNYITMNSNTSNNHYIADSSPNNFTNIDDSLRSAKNDNNGFSGLKIGSILTLGIDFLPAVLDEKKVSQYLSWHCSSELEDELKGIQKGIITDVSQDRSERDKYGGEKEREKDNDIYYYYNSKSSRRSSDYKPKSGKKSGKNSFSSSNSVQSSHTQASASASSSVSSDANKKKRGRKTKRKNITTFTEFSLFTLFENEEAGEIMFNILDEENENNQQSESDEKQETEDELAKSKSSNELDRISEIADISNNENDSSGLRSKSDSIDTMNKLLNQSDS